MRHLTICVIWLYCYMAHGLFGYIGPWTIWLFGCIVIWPMGYGYLVILSHRLFDISNMAYGLFHIFKFLGSNFLSLEFETLSFSCMIFLGFEGLMFIL